MVTGGWPTVWPKPWVNDRIVATVSNLSMGRGRGMAKFDKRPFGGFYEVARVVCFVAHRNEFAR